jgi:hypothetical protein
VSEALWEYAAEGGPEPDAVYVLAYCAQPFRVEDGGGWPAFFLTDVIRAHGGDPTDAHWNDPADDVMMSLEAVVDLDFDEDGLPTTPFGRWLQAAVRLSDTNIKAEALAEGFMAYALEPVRHTDGTLTLRQEAKITGRGIAEIAKVMDAGKGTPAAGRRLKSRKGQR